MATFELTKMATNMLYPGNFVEYDDNDMPSIMVYIPAFKNSDVLVGGDDSTHPAFIVNGEEIPGFYYSKFQNVVLSPALGESGVSMAYSLPGEDPKTRTGFDTVLGYCEAKGHGWHLSTNAEWAAIALWCKKNGFLPYGNNYYGKDSRETNYQALPTDYDNDGKIIRVATGTGPVSWSHDGTESGIWDMNGNVWERQAGIRVVWGELQILDNNDAADPDNPQNDTSVCWKAIKASDGSLVTPESKTTDTAGKTSGSTVKLDCVNNVWTYSTGITTVIDSTDKSNAFAAMTCTDKISNAAKVLLRSLALLPDEGATAADYENDVMYWTNAKNECVLYRGGSNIHSSTAGIFSSSCVAIRSSANQSVGFRCAYIPDIKGAW